MTPRSDPALFRSAQFEAVSPKPRSIATRFVFAEVREFTIKQLCNGEAGVGAMAEMEFARIAEGHVCADTPVRPGRRCFAAHHHYLSPGSTFGPRRGRRHACCA